MDRRAQSTQGRQSMKVRPLHIRSNIVVPTRMATTYSITLTRNRKDLNFMSCAPFVNPARLYYGVLVEYEYRTFDIRCDPANDTGDRPLIPLTHPAPNGLEVSARTLGAAMWSKVALAGNASTTPVNVGIPLNGDRRTMTCGEDDTNNVDDNSLLTVGGGDGPASDAVTVSSTRTISNAKGHIHRPTVTPHVRQRST